MRMLPSRYIQPRPAQIKKREAISKIKHVSAPLKGLSLSSKLVKGDPLSATVLDNWVVEENQIRCRPGTVRVHADVDVAPVEHLVPFYGAPNKLAGAIAGKLIEIDGTVIQTGFSNNDWSWTAFSNLSSQDYTVMVNGADGVWSWDGNAVPDPGAVTVTSISNANPAVVTVGAGDISKFANGQAVLITFSGTPPAGFANAAGLHYIGGVNVPPNTFALVGIDTSTGTGPATVGITANAPGSMQKEIVTAPPTATWVNPDQMNIVLAHQNRLFFADSANLAFYYLPLQQKGGELKVFPLNAIFKRGGTIRAMYTWTTEGAINLNDQLAIFTSNGELAIYGGIDPDTDFELSGLFRFDSPISKHCVINYGGELYALISTGLVPMSTLMRAESEQLGQSDRNIFSNFYNASLRQRDHGGWSVIVNPSSGRVICNIPQGGNEYSQMVRFMPNPIWATWSALKSRCWGWVDNRLFFGTDRGEIFEMHPQFLNDNGNPIRVDVQAAWSDYGTPASKQFKMVLPYIQSDGTPKPFVDIKVDYDMTPPNNQPDVTFADSGATWDLATWAIDQDTPPDGAFWAQGVASRNNWSGVAADGRVAGPRLVALVLDCEFSLTGWDVMFESGSALG